jgi:beta-lactamase class A
MPKFIRLHAATLLTLLAILAPPDTASAQEAHRDILRTQLQERIEAVVSGYGGVAGVHAIDLTDGTRFAFRDDLIFPQASSIKIPILLELFRRAEREPGLLARRVEVTDAVRTGGSGVLLHLTDGGSALSLEDHAIYMILYSDNTSTNILIDALGMNAINALSASLGAPETRLQRKMIQPEASARGEENLSTPRDAARIMERIAACDLPMSENSCRRVQEILAIPKGGGYVDPVAPGTPILWKPGGITGVATAWGIVDLADRPYVLVVMSSYGGDGNALIREISALVWDYFSRLAGVTEYGTRVPLDIKRRLEAEARAGAGVGAGAVGGTSAAGASQHGGHGEHGGHGGHEGAGMAGGAAPSDDPTATEDRHRAELERAYWAAVEARRSRFTEADVQFMQGMIAHHGQALMMVSHVGEATGNPEIRLLASRIEISQRDEIRLMEDWLRARSQLAPGSPDHDHGHGHGHGPTHTMPGMLTEAQLAELAESRGASFDTLFLALMIEHHQGAVSMVRELFAQDGAAQDPEVFRFASDVHVDQITEIARMEQMLRRLRSSTAAASPEAFSLLP